MAGYLIVGVNVTNDFCSNPSIMRYWMYLVHPAEQSSCNMGILGSELRVRVRIKG